MKTGILDLITKNRSYRRFYQDIEIPYEALESMIEAARLSPSGANRQPLKYIICQDGKGKTGREIFDCLVWAGYLKDWDGPVEGERPAAYIIMLHDKIIHTNIYCDQGIALQSIMLQAVSMGFGGCIFASINRPRLSKFLDLPESLEILHVVALGQPKETVVIDKTNPDLTAGENIKYWRDADGVHHVPKRSLSELIIKK